MSGGAYDYAYSKLHPGATLQAAIEGAEAAMRELADALEEAKARRDR